MVTNIAVRGLTLTAGLDFLNFNSGAREFWRLPLNEDDHVCFRFRTTTTLYRYVIAV